MSDKHFAKLKMDDLTVVIGVDVGGTNTDAVVLDKSTETARILSEVKTTTTADIASGVRESIRLVLLNLQDRFTKLAVQQVNVGTTHFVNAVVQGKRLAKVSVIRLCGTASKRLPPFSDFPESFAEKIQGSVFMTSGGCQFDAQEISEIDENEILSCLDMLKAKGESNIVVSGIFSPIRQDQEIKVVNLIKEHYPEASVTASHLIGRLGLLERENAAIMNECIKPLCKEAINGFRESLEDLGLKCPLFLTQNDGTIMSEDTALQFPVHTFASGPTNSMRGAAFLSGLEDAFVIDVGGTSTDVGVLTKGFPRHASAEVKIAGIRTNFRMPDVISIGLGGGSYVKSELNKVKVGPLSAGYRIPNEAYVFAEDGDLTDRLMTATDIAVAAGLAEVGNPENVAYIPHELVQSGVSVIQNMISNCIDQMRFNDRNIPLILVGGGSILVDTSKEFEGVSAVVKPDHYGVANAVGAALSQVSASIDRTVDLQTYIDASEMDTELNMKQSQKSKDGLMIASLNDSVRREFLKKARDKALEETIKQAKEEVLKAGGAKQTVQLLDKEDIPVSYIPGNATRLLVKVTAEMELQTETKYMFMIDSLKNKHSPQNLVKEKQTVTATGKRLESSEEEAITETTEYAPNINETTGEWLLCPYDIECLYIGAGILATGGGGNPHLGKISALRALKTGKRMRVVTPSMFFKSADKKNDLVVNVAFMGAPLVIYEKPMSGNESRGALESMQDMFNERQYRDGEMLNAAGVDIKTEGGATFIENYKLTKKQDTFRMGEHRVAAVMGMEIGGLNSMEPLIVGAELDLPIIDCDGMGRAFPELQMISQFMYGCESYPSAVADDKGQCAVLLKCDNAKQLEECFRRICITMGCTAGIVLSYINAKQVLDYTIQHSLSYAWRIGRTILEARRQNKSAVEEMMKCTNGRLLINGKLTDVRREITGGFTKGRIVIDGLETFAGKTITIDFQNEFLVARYEEEGQAGDVLACVPDLITVLDIDTAQPIPTEEVHYGMRISVVAMPVSPLMATERALKWVGPQAFGYSSDILYTPVSEFPNYGPIGPI